MAHALNALASKAVGLGFETGLWRNGDEGELDDDDDDDDDVDEYDDDDDGSYDGDSYDNRRTLKDAKGLS